MGDDEPSAADEIMEGVYQALVTHGYAGLTMQDIADECSKSKSLLHYHYDTKEDLLVAFLEYIISDFETKVAESADKSPTERIVEFAGWFVFEPDEVERESFHIALLELRSQGPFNDRIREQLERSDYHLRRTAADIIREGIDSGDFEPINVDETAALLVATLDGARTRQITLGSDILDADSYTRTVAETAIERVIEPIVTPGTTLPELSVILESLSEDAETETDEPGPENEADDEEFDSDETEDDPGKADTPNRNSDVNRGDDANQDSDVNRGDDANQNDNPNPHDDASRAGQHNEDEVE